MLLYAIGIGRQLNAGARAASHKMLLFIQVDTLLCRNYDALAVRALAKPGVVAGVYVSGQK